MRKFHELSKHYVNMLNHCFFSPSVFFLLYQFLVILLILSNLYAEDKKCSLLIRDHYNERRVLGLLHYPYRKFQPCLVHDVSLMPDRLATIRLIPGTRIFGTRACANIQSQVLYLRLDKDSKYSTNESMHSSSTLFD